MLINSFKQNPTPRCSCSGLLKLRVKQFQETKRGPPPLSLLRTPP